MSDEFVQLSLVPMLIGSLAGIACALPGNFLVLRRQALIGDANDLRGGGGGCDCCFAH